MNIGHVHAAASLMLLPPSSFLLPPPPASCCVLNMGLGPAIKHRTIYPSVHRLCYLFWQLSFGLRVVVVVVGVAVAFVAVFIVFRYSLFACSGFAGFKCLSWLFHSIFLFRSRI